MLAANTVSFELYPTESLRGEDAIKTIESPRDAKAVSLTLHVPRGQPDVSYTVTVRDETHEVWAARLNLKSGALRARIPANLLHPGSYRVKVVAGKDEVKITAEYEFKIKQ